MAKLIVWIVPQAVTNHFGFEENVWVAGPFVCFFHQESAGEVEQCRISKDIKFAPSFVLRGTAYAKKSFEQHVKDQRNLWYFVFFLRVQQNSLICIISLSYFVLNVHILHVRYHNVYFLSCFHSFVT